MSARSLLNICTYGFAGMVLAFCVPAQASLLGPGQTDFSNPVSAPSGTTVQGPLNSMFSGGSGPTAFSGTLTTTVIQENSTNNPLGGLTFEFQFSNNAASQVPIGRMTSDDFTGFITDVGYVSGGVQPTSDDRNAGALGWTFSPGTSPKGEVDPGSTTDLLVIRTNAPLRNDVTANLLGGASATAASYGPLPEPGSLALIACGSLFFKRRRA